MPGFNSVLLTSMHNLELILTLTGGLAAALFLTFSPLGFK